jgi:hypothetical protein
MAGKHNECGATLSFNWRASLRGGKAPPKEAGGLQKKNAQAKRRPSVKKEAKRSPAPADTISGSPARSADGDIGIFRPVDKESKAAPGSPPPKLKSAAEAAAVTPIVCGSPADIAPPTEPGEGIMSPTYSGDEFEPEGDGFTDESEGGDSVDLDDPLRALDIAAAPKVRFTNGTPTMEIQEDGGGEGPGWDDLLEGSGNEEDIGEESIQCEPMAATDMAASLEATDALWRTSNKLQVLRTLEHQHNQQANR